MSGSVHKAFSDRLPEQVEIENAEQLQKILTSQMDDRGQAELVLTLDQGHAQPVTLTPALAKSLLEVVRLVSSGRGFRMIPVDAHLTTQDAADCLNVSRPYLIKLLENGAIPFTKTGRHRKIRAEDLFQYKEKRDQERTKALGELAELDAENDLL